MSRLRLLKVIVQPVFAIDDGETLSESAAEPVVVAAVDWPTYPATRFLDAVDALQAELDTQTKATAGLASDALASFKT